MTYSIGEVNMEHTLNVRGESKLSVMPDRIIIKLEIVTTNIKYDYAINESKNKYNSLLNSLRLIGFQQEDLKTNSFNVETLYENKLTNNIYENIFTGYRIRHSLSIEMDLDMQKLNGVINSITKSIANPELTIRFSLKEKQAILDKLLKLCIEDAKQKANFIADNFGIKLIEIINIEYSQKEINVISHSEYRPKLMAADMALTPEDIIVNDYINVTWSI